MLDFVHSSLVFCFVLQYSTSFSCTLIALVFSWFICCRTGLLIECPGNGQLFVQGYIQRVVDYLVPSRIVGS